MKQQLIEFKVETDNWKIILEDLNIPLSIMDSSTGKKISKKADQLNNTVNHMDLADSYKILHFITAESIFFLITPRIFSKEDYMLGHKMSQ